MFKRIYCIAVSCLLLAQCAGTIKVMPEYKNMDVENSRLGIVLLKERMVITNRNDIAAYVGEGATEDVFFDFFTSRFKEFAQNEGRFEDVAIVNGCDTVDFTKSTLFLSSDEPVQVSIPAKKAYKSDSLPFLIVLDNLTISRDLKPGRTVVTTGPHGTMGTRKVGACDNLIMTGTFVLWDNLAGKIVSFGKINVKTDALMTGMTAQTWISAVESVSSKIFTDTPYGMPSVPSVE